MIPYPGPAAYQPVHAPMKPPRAMALVVVVGLAVALVCAPASAVVPISAVVDAVIQLFCGVAFICWLYRVRANLDAVPEDFRWSAGWAIGGWFVPIASMFIPLAIVGEVDRASARRAGRPRRIGVFVGWVVSWTAYTVVDNVTGVMFRLRIADRGAPHILWVSIAGVLGAVAAGFAILLVRRITVNQETLIANRPTRPSASVLGPVP
jgi:uncharacterized membrane protein